MPAFTLARPADREPLAAMLRDFYAEEHLRFVPAVLRALDELLAAPAQGGAYLIQDNSAVAGYFILTFGFSIERGGKTALLDELYVLPGFRRKGLGKAAVAQARDSARAAACRVLFLEVDPSNVAAQTLYMGAGFSGLPRHFLALPLDE